MEFHDILADHMYICWPPFFFIILYYCQVVEESIIPYIGHLRSIKWEWYPEFVRLTRYRKIFQSSFYKFDDLIISRSWLDEIRMRLIECKDLILIF